MEGTKVIFSFISNQGGKKPDAGKGIENWLVSKNNQTRVGNKEGDAIRKANSGKGRERKRASNWGAL